MGHLQAVRGRVGAVPFPTVESTSDPEIALTGLAPKNPPLHSNHIMLHLPHHSSSGTGSRACCPRPIYKVEARQLLLMHPSPQRGTQAKSPGQCPSPPSFPCFRAAEASAIWGFLCPPPLPGSAAHTMHQPQQEAGSQGAPERPRLGLVPSTHDQQQAGTGHPSTLGTGEGRGW